MDWRTNTGIWQFVFAAISKQRDRAGMAMSSVSPGPNILKPAQRVGSEMVSSRIEPMTSWIEPTPSTDWASPQQHWWNLAGNKKMHKEYACIGSRLFFLNPCLVLDSVNAWGLCTRWVNDGFFYVVTVMRQSNYCIFNPALYKINSSGARPDYIIQIVR